MTKTKVICSILMPILHLIFYNLYVKSEQAQRDEIVEIVWMDERAFGYYRFFAVCPRAGRS